MPKRKAEPPLPDSESLQAFVNSRPKKHSIYLWRAQPFVYELLSPCSAVLVLGGLDEFLKPFLRGSETLDDLKTLIEKYRHVLPRLEFRPDLYMPPTTSFYFADLGLLQDNASGYGAGHNVLYYSLPLTGKWSLVAKDYLADNRVPFSEVPTPMYDEWLMAQFSTAELPWLMALLGATIYRYSHQNRWSTYLRLILEDGKELETLRHLLLPPEQTWIHFTMGQKIPDPDILDVLMHVRILLLKQLKSGSQEELTPDRNSITGEATLMDIVEEGELHLLDAKVPYNAISMEPVVYQSRSDWEEGTHDKTAGIEFHVLAPPTSSSLEEEKPLWVRKCMLAYIQFLASISDVACISGFSQSAPSARIREAIRSEYLWWL